jgi:septal ring factor EnvC (AmiA/AmiB activator)
MNQIPIRSTKNRAVPSLRLLAAAAGLVTLAACASAPPAPTHALQAAEIAITNAEQARVADYASIELNEARENLAAARKAVQDKDMARAELLAEQSRVNAELASANAELTRARAINEEMQKSIDILKQEMQRGPGARP